MRALTISKMTSCWRHPLRACLYPQHASRPSNWPSNYQLWDNRYSGLAWLLSWAEHLFSCAGPTLNVDDWFSFRECFRRRILKPMDGIVVSLIKKEPPACRRTLSAGSRRWCASLSADDWWKQESPAIADKPARRESLPKIAPIRRAYNVVADNWILAYLHSFSCYCVRNLQCPAKFTENSSLWSSRSSKVIDLGVNRKPMYDFLLVTNSNFGRICYRFRDIDA